MVVFGQNIYAQKVDLNEKDKSLSLVLEELREKCNLQLAFDYQSISDFTVNINKSFNNPEDAIAFLIKGLPIGYEIINGAIILFPDAGKVKKEFLFSGMVVDSSDHTPLPYAKVSTDNKSVITDEHGKFSFFDFSPLLRQVNVSYLGYFPSTITLRPGVSENIALTPKPVYLNEIIIESATNYVKNARVGEDAGKIKVNPVIARSLPGYGDNSIFNYLSLMPGIFTSESSPEHLSIRGSNPGENLILFDGFKLYKTWHNLENIGLVNPLLIRNIEVDKSGYDASYGDQIGSLLNISGVSGNLKQSGYTINLNTTTLNIVVEQPITKRSSLIFGTRRTYFNNFPKKANNTSQLDEIRTTGKDESKIFEGSVVPKYDFSDWNLKYVGKTSSDDPYYISLFYASDRLHYDVENNFSDALISDNSENQSDNYGGALFYGKTFQSGLRMNNTLSFSGAANSLIETSLIQSADTTFGNYLNSKNSINEANLSTNGYLPLSPNNSLQFGIKFETGSTIFNNQSEDKKVADNSKTSFVSLYIQDLIETNGRLKVQPGLRCNYIFNEKKFLLSPRLLLRYSFLPNWKLTLRSGLYHQNTIYVPIKGTFNSFTSYWRYADWEKFKPEISFQNTVGFLFMNKGFEANTELYYSKSKNHVNSSAPNLYYNETFGLDVFLKKEIKNLTGWLSYSYLIKQPNNSSPSESPFFDKQINRHEVKLAGYYNTKNLTFSANYILGVTDNQFETIDNNLYVNDLSRLDFGTSYRIVKKRINGEFGFSFMNLLNTQNSYSNFGVINSSFNSNSITSNSTTSEVEINTGTINTDAISYKLQKLPRTLEIFLRISF